MDAITEKKDTQKIDLKNSDQCPVCGSYDIEGDHFDVAGNVAFQKVCCNECGARWSDSYRLESRYVFDVPDELKDRVHELTRHADSGVTYLEDTGEYEIRVTSAN